MKKLAARGASVAQGQSPRIDEYIADAAPFALPILTHLRALVHRTSPEITEDIKWSQPFFLYRGELLCFMAAFKQHCSFGFWGSEMAAVLKRDGREAEGDAKGSRGVFGRIRTIGDLPSDKEMLGYIRQAIALAESPEAKPAKVRKPKPELPTPPAFEAAMNDKPGAPEAFALLSPSCRREYITWITEAKRAETQERRIQTAVQWISEGKSLNWKYENC